MTASNIVAITGGAGALGSELARSLVREGSVVALLDSTHAQDRLAALAAELGPTNAFTYAGDLASADVWSTALGAIEAALGRREAAARILDGLALDREADDGWPFSAEESVAAQRAGTATGTTLLARIFSRTMGTRTNGASPPSEDALVVGASGAWFRPPRGARVGLERRRSLALLLDHLARSHVEQPGAPARAAVLFSAAWPGEKAIASAAAHRVRVAVATLRKLGLRDCLVTTPEGYALTPTLEVVRA